MINVKKLQHGFTLIEVIVTLTLYSIVIVFVMGVLLPAVKFSARYSDNESDTAFLTYAQEALTENIRYAERIMIYSNTDDRVTDEEFARPKFGYYDLNDNLFKKKVTVTWSDEKQLISAPRKPEKGTDFIIHISRLNGEFIGNKSDLTVKLILKRNDRIVSKTEFSVRALNAPVDFDPEPEVDVIEEGMQAICIE